MLSLSALGPALIYLAIWGTILYVVWWGIRAVALPEPWSKVATVLLVIATVVILVNFLQGFAGVPVFHPR